MAVTRGGAARRTSRSTTTDDLSVSMGSVPDEIKLEDVDANNRGPLKVLFLSADTGGGHRGKFYV